MITAENNLFVPKPEPKPHAPTLATVSAVVTGGVKLRMDGEETARAKTFKRLASYTPTVGDRVYIVGVSGTYIVVGKVV